MEDLYKNIIANIKSYLATQISLAPTYGYALIFVVLGLFLAFAAEILAKKFIKSIEQIFGHSLSSKNNLRLREFYAVVISKILFWSILIYFIDHAVNIVEWRIAMNLLDKIVHFIPKLIAGVVIILGGFLLSNYLKKVFTSYINDLSAVLLQYTLILIFVLLGIQQIGININFVTQIILVATAAILGCITLALGLGSKTITANVIGIWHARKHIAIGDRIQVGSIDGEIVEITSTDIIIKDATGLNIIPGKTFQEKNTSIIVKGATEIKNDQ